LQLTKVGTDLKLSKDTASGVFGLRAVITHKGFDAAENEQHYSPDIAAAGRGGRG